MQATPNLICLVLISIAQATLVTSIPKPNLNLTHSLHLESPEILKQKSPEERRKSSLFPKSYMKFVISSEPIYKIPSHKPMVHGTKKPLMKKLILHDNKNIVVENETEQPIIISTEPINEQNSAVTPEVDTAVVIEETSVESEESNEKQNDNSEEEDKLQKDSNEFKKATADPENKESPNLKDLKYSHKEKPIEVSTENENMEAFSDVSDITKSSKEIETPHWTELIFIEPAHKPTDGDQISSEKPEEYIDTEFYEEPEIVRQKRIAT